MKNILLTLLLFVGLCAVLCIGVGLVFYVELNTEYPTEYSVDGRTRLSKSQYDEHIAAKKATGVK